MRFIGFRWVFSVLDVMCYLVVVSLLGWDSVLLCGLFRFFRIVEFGSQGFWDFPREGLGVGCGWSLGGRRLRCWHMCVCNIFRNGVDWHGGVGLVLQ